MIRRAFIAAVAVILLAGCGGDDPQTNSGTANATSSDSATLILAVGDSIGTGHNIATGWPLKVQSATGVEVVNQSQKSRKTSDVVGSVPAWMDQYKPSHVMILLGTNDARGGSVSGAITNLTNWANSARQRGITIIIGTVPPNTADAGANARAEQISAGIREISGAKIADVRRAMGSGGGLLADGIHPNDAGQSTIASTFVSQL